MAFTPVSDDSEFEFPPNSFDVRGWEVRTMADGEKVGEVEEILIDGGRELRYLDVALGPVREHVLVPIERARVDESEEVVWVPGMTKTQLERASEYRRRENSRTPEYRKRLDVAYPEAGRGGRGVVRNGPLHPTTRPADEAQRRTLARLRDLHGYRVTMDAPDPRGWKVVASDDRVVGRVDDLIVDTTTRKVRHLDCVLASRGSRGGNDHILVPLGFARLVKRRRSVVVEAFTSAEVGALPRFEGLPLTAREEDRLVSAYLSGFERSGGGYGRTGTGRRRGKGAG